MGNFVSTIHFFFFIPLSIVDLEEMVSIVSKFKKFELQKKGKFTLKISSTWVMCGGFRADPAGVLLERALTSDGLRPESALPPGCHSLAPQPSPPAAAEDSSSPCTGRAGG